MKIMLRQTISILLFLLPVAMTTPSFATTPAQTTIAPMLQTVLPAIVNIKAQIKITDYNTMQQLQKEQSKHKSKGMENDNDPSISNNFVSIASGVIVDANNAYIITNAHAINDAQLIAITLSDGRHYTAKVIGTDKPSDIALLQIKAKNLKAIPIGDSNAVKVGDFVAAIGNPFGLSQSVTSGIVSAVGRTTLGIENFENFIQTDAPINQGNSGGALINMDGQLIGINTAILAPDRGSVGIGFAIPANMVKTVMLQLLQYGDVKRGVLGIGAQDVTPELATAFHLDIPNGAVVTQVLPDSPAAQGGVHVGDIITAINGATVKNASDVINTIGFLRVDSKINMSVIRDKKPQTVNVTLTDPKKRREIAEHTDPFLYNTTLKDFSLLSPVHGNVQGVLVVTVDPDSNAWHSDLRPGDVITTADLQKVTSAEALKAISAKADKALLLNVLRGPSAVFLVINKEY